MGEQNKLGQICPGHATCSPPVSSAQSPGRDVRGDSERVAVSVPVLDDKIPGSASDSDVCQGNENVCKAYLINADIMFYNLQMQ